MNIRYVAPTRKKFHFIIPFLFWMVFLFNPLSLAWGEGVSPVILTFGDSLTAGFGVSDTQNYPSKLQGIISRSGYPHKVINGGVTGDTTAGGVRRINWVMKHNPKIVILELGANDGLRGLSLEEMESNLERIINVCTEGGAKILLAGMKIPPNYGEEYTVGFEKIYTRLAEKHQLALLPFFLEGVAGLREFTQPDGIHPLAPGYTIVAQTVFQYLEPLLKKKP
jgi:acyl-CoA thioesterase-1